MPDANARSVALRLLLAEDDELLGRGTCIALRQAGHAVDWVTSGNQFLTELSRQTYDCALLDLGLPELSGEDCLRGLRTRRQRLPVIVITARGQVHDRIAVLDLGADDYMVKPYDLKELAARIRAVTRRRCENPATDELNHGPLTLRLATRIAVWYGNAVPLTGKEFLLLAALLRAPSRMMTRGHIERALYGWGEEIGSNTVEVNVHNLRRKLDPRLIITMRGVGYRIAPVDNLPEASVGMRGDANDPR